MKSLAATLLLLVPGTTLADPRISSWFTEDSGRYARIYPNAAAENAGTTATTWNKGAGVQSAPTYAGVSKVAYSTNWVYIQTTGLAGHIMGPWPANFPNFPSNRAKTYRIPRNPVVPATKTLTGLGAIGAMVNGVSMFDMRDAFSYVSASATDSTPGNGLTGDGIWNREAYHNESDTFDPAQAHQAGNNYHYHAQPIGLRYQLGDHVDYNPVTNRYSEKIGPVTKHSPIVAWAADGLPVYGPYGYSSPLDPHSGLRRMVSGFVLRDGTIGTTNLAATRRTSLPAWAQRIQTAAFKNGPDVGTNYQLGHYIEDFDYLGDLGFDVGIDFDLNESNVRWCVTPEFPTGTYAYFTTIKADGTPAYPYTTGRQYFGSPSGGNATINEPVTIHFMGGPNKTEQADQVVVDPASGDVSLTWSAVEGGTYLVEASINLSQWTDIASDVVATRDLATLIEANAEITHPTRFYRVSRTSLAAFDANGFDYTPPGSAAAVSSIAPGGSADGGTLVTVTITLPATPPNPPATVVPTTVTLGGVAGTSISRPGATTVQATFPIPDTPGAQNIIVTFNPGPTYTLTGAFTIR